MAVVCKSCGRQYDITLFEFGRTVSCDCGNIIDLKTKVLLMRKAKDLKERIGAAFKLKREDSS